MRRRAPLVAVVAVALALAVVAWLQRPASRPPRDEPRAPISQIRTRDEAPRAMGAEAPAAVTPAPPALGVAPAPPLARSLRGTDVDGGFATDARGRIVPTADAVRLFDYFLSAEGEESDEAIRGHVDAFARAHLDGAAARDAMRLFDRYVDYRAAVAITLERDVAPGDLRAALAAVGRAQDAAFGADAERLFGDDRRLAAASVAEAEAVADPSLTPEQLAQRREAAEATLPADLREARARRNAIESLAASAAAR